MFNGFIAKPGFASPFSVRPLCVCVCICFSWDLSSHLIAAALWPVRFYPNLGQTVSATDIRGGPTCSSSACAPDRATDRDPATMWRSGGEEINNFWMRLEKLTPIRGVIVDWVIPPATFRIHYSAQDTEGQWLTPLLKCPCVCLFPPHVSSPCVCHSNARNTTQRDPPHGLPCRAAPFHLVALLAPKIRSLPPKNGFRTRVSLSAPFLSLSVWLSETRQTTHHKVVS